MITEKELTQLKHKYGGNPGQLCRLCGKPMQLRTMYPHDELAFYCLGSEARKYSRAWWGHFEMSKTTNESTEDPLVMKLIEEYEGVVGERSTN